jgi:hypothetical protein
MMTKRLSLGAQKYSHMGSPMQEEPIDLTSDRISKEATILQMRWTGHGSI